MGRVVHHNHDGSTQTVLFHGDRVYAVTELTEAEFREDLARTASLYAPPPAYRAGGHAAADDDDADPTSITDTDTTDPDTTAGETTTEGGTTSGYSLIGSIGIAIRPAAKITIDSTAAKIGRLMKNFDMAQFPIVGVTGRPGRARCRPLTM